MYENIVMCVCMYVGAGGSIHTYTRVENAGRRLGRWRSWS